MAFFQLRTPPASPPLPPFVVQVWNAYQELERTQWRSPIELEKIQLILDPP
jgi:hypothetical protein